MAFADIRDGRLPDEVFREDVDLLLRRVLLASSVYGHRLSWAHTPNASEGMPNPDWSITHSGHQRGMQAWLAA